MSLRALPVFFLALFASAEALALQHTEDEGTLAPPREAWTFWKDPGSEKRALLIIHGLLRQFGHFWPLLQRNFIEPNTKAGYNFTIVLHTSLSRVCNDKDVLNVSLNKDHWCSPFMQMYGNSTEERRATLHRMFTPHHVQLVDTADPCWSMPGDSGRAQTQYLQGEWRHGGCSGTVHFASRGTQALDSFRGKRGFHKVVIIRTDNCFELQGHKKEEWPVMLDEACAHHPGVNIVASQNEVPTYYGHDHDHAWMLCDGSRADVFRDAVAAFGLFCQAPCSAPPKCPKGFCVGHVGCAENICESLATLERGGVRMGTLDDYMIANYRNTSAEGLVELGREPGDRDGEGHALA